MPIPVKQTIKSETPKVINVAKIGQLSIDVNLKQITVGIQYGATSNDVLNVVDTQMIRITGDDFINIAEAVTKGGRIYDEMGEILYTWLSTNNKLKYTV